jgi:hypothetical protein
MVVSAVLPEDIFTDGLGWRFSMRSDLKSGDTFRTTRCPTTPTPFVRFDRTGQ